MRFLRRNRYVFGFLAVLVACSALVQLQIVGNQSAHIRMREDFIFLEQHGHAKPGEHLYQLLIQELPRENDKSLLDDFQRTSLLLITNKPSTETLLWKYHISLRNEFTHRAEKRVAHLLEQARE